MLDKIKIIIGIKNVKDCLEIISWISVSIIAFLTLQVYNQQLRLDEHSNNPSFEIRVIPKYQDETVEHYLQIINNGKPIENKQIDTFAVLWLERIENNDTSTFKNIPIKVENFFYNDNDKIKYGSTKDGIICERETNFHYIYLCNEIYNIGKKLNDTYEKSIQIYPSFKYFVKITYKDYVNKNKTKYYEVGNFTNIEISEEKYSEMFNLTKIDVNKDYHDNLVDILK